MTEQQKASDGEVEKSETQHTSGSAEPQTDQFTIFTSRQPESCITLGVVGMRKEWWVVVSKSVNFPSFPGKYSNGYLAHLGG
jgi:hypothetical protein